MTTLSASSSRPADAGYAAAATLVAVVLFLFSWALLHRGFFAHDPIVDTPVYERYGSAIDSGQVPYRDFALEYPPGALPVFVLPALGGAHGDSYRRRFEALMALLGELMLVTVAVALAALGAGRRWLLAALGLAAVAPLLLGPVVLSRFDLWPAALTAIALAALAGDRLRLGHLALGAAVAAKLYAAVLVPIALVYVWRRRGRREALVCGALLLAVVAIAFVPFLIVAPDGVWDSLWNQASRPLQIESLGAALLLVSHHVFGTGVTMESSHGSQNLAGTTADAFAVAQSVLQLSTLARGLDPVRARPGDADEAPLRERRRPGRVRRARQGALAAVPDLADPGRAPSTRPPRTDRRGRAHGRARPHPALVPVPLLGPRAPLRNARVVARPAQRPRAARAAGGRRPRISRARPGTSHSS